MSSTFAQLKQNRKSNFDKLSEELEKASGKTSYQNDDERFWYPTVDKVGNGYAVIRFLPPPANEDVPFVRVFEHAFQGPSGSWYIEKSLTTLDRPDPVSEYNSRLWNSGVESDKTIARKQKRKLNFISNIYVVSDPAHPENDGKVFLFKYGKQIFDVLYAANNPQHPGDVKMDPFDLWEGANMRVKIRNKDGYRNYESSVFEAPAPLLKDEKKLEEIWKQEYPLQPFIDPKEFKSYDELKAKFYRVIAAVPGPESAAAPLRIGGLEADTAPTEVADKLPESPPWLEDSNDEELNFFKNLAEDDAELIS